MDTAPDKQSPELKKVVQELREKPIKVIVIALGGQPDKLKDIASGDNLVVIPNTDKPTKEIASLPLLIFEGTP